MSGFRCACGRPAAVRVTQPGIDITIIAPCEDHVGLILLDTIRRYPLLVLDSLIYQELV